MEPTDRPRVKICSIGSVEEAKLAIRYGASALGLVSEMPNYSGVVSEALIAQVAGMVPPSVSSFLLTNKHNALEVMAQQRRLGVNTIQICDQLQFSTYEDLRQKLPGINLVQVIHVTGSESIEEAVAVAPHVSGLLLDNGNQDLAATEVVTTEPVRDWEISRRIRESVEVPVFLAGGLNPDNVTTAIGQVKPFAVNVGDGIRTNGKLDENKLSKFVSQVWGAFSN